MVVIGGVPIDGGDDIVLGTGVSDPRGNGEVAPLDQFKLHHGVVIAFQIQKEIGRDVEYVPNAVTCAGSDDETYWQE